MNKEGAIAGMITGLAFTSIYILYFKFWGGSPDEYWFNISPEGIGTLGMIFNFVVSLTVSAFTKDPPQWVQNMVSDIRIPRGSGDAVDH